MTNSGSVRERVVRHLLRVSDVSLQPADVRPDSTLREFLALNSLQALSLMLELEDEFDVVVEDDEVERLRTVADVVSLIESKLAGRG